MKNQLSEIAELIEEEVRNEFKNEREELRIQARDAILKIQEQNRRNYNAKRKKARKYEVDDLVSIAKTQFATGAKVKPKNIGPYKITKIKANDRYNVEKIGCHEGPGQTSTAADNMKPWPSINIIDLKPSIPKTIVVEGNIGSGKSTLLQYFSRNEKVEIHHEPVQQWQNVNGINLFQMMYSNPEQYGFPFQIYAALTMLQTHLKASTKPVKMMERSVLSVKNCFIENLRENNTIEPVLIDVMNEWLSFHQENFPVKIDYIIYLRTNPETLIKRIQKRGRHEEKNVTIEHLRQIHLLYEKWLTNYSDDNCKIIVINADVDESQIQIEYQRIEDIISEIN